MGEKAREKLLEELLEAQEILEKKTETHDQRIKRFQTLVENAGLFSQIIDFLPYPLAIFTPQYTLVITNKAFAAATKMRVMHPKKGAERILKHKIIDMQLATAITRIFNGDTFFLEGLKNPFSMFSGCAEQSTSESDRFSKAVIFPIPADDAEITHGVIVIMP